MKKRIFSLLLTLCMLSAFVPITETNVSAASDAAIQQRINELITHLNGKYFTTNQTSCGNSSCSNCYVNNVIRQSWFTDIFGTIPSVYNLAKYYYFANDVNYTVGGPTLGAYSCAGFASFAEWYIFKNSNSDSVQTELVGVYPVSEVSKHAMVGDMLRIKWWSSYRGAWSYHSGIYLGQNSPNSVYILDSNGGISRNQVLTHNFNCTAVVITRAKNRNISGSGLSGGGATVSTPKPHSHSYSTTETESSHPHNQYKKCSCGSRTYIGKKAVKSCSSCYPLGNARLTREFNRTSGRTTFYRNNVSNANDYTLNIYRNGSLQISRDMSDTSYTTTLDQGYTYTAELTAKNTNTGQRRTVSCNSFKILNTYNVSYNANGGSGAPSSQTKIQDENLTLSSSKPTKAHYVFKGWASSKTATSAQYQAGDRYTKNAKITLYAVWEPEIYTINFDANGGKGDLESAKITYGNSMRMPNNVVNTGYYLRGWATNKNATEPQYKIGVDYKLEADTTLYAVWGSTGWAQEIADGFAGGDGTEENPYQISNAAELAYLANAVNSQTAIPEYKYYKLTDNINLGYNEWVPIGLYGNNTQLFYGSFDGNGFTISDIYMTESRENYVGLFGFVKDSEIKNLTITGAIENISSANILNVGGIAGYIGNTNVSSCNALYFTVSGLSAEVNSTYSRAGCIIGKADNGLISDCKANECSINLKAGNFDAGIIIGQAKADVENSFVTASENGLFSTVSTAEGVSFGGLCGYLSKTAETCSVSAPYLTNEIQGTSTASYNIGGLVGNLAGELKVCSAQFDKGKIKTINGEEYGNSIYVSSSGGTTFAGGLIGKGITDSAKISDCKYDGQSVTSISDGTGYGIAGGLAGRMTAKSNPTVSVNNGGTLNPKKLPKKDGYTATWYTDSTFKNEYDFSQAVTGNMILYAKWEEAEEQPKPHIWDGTSKQPAYNSSTKTYTVTSGEELAWISDFVNGEIPSDLPVDTTMSGYTVELANDIYLNDISNWQSWNDTTTPANSWRPIGNPTNSFNGTFNGNGHEVKGIYINAPSADYQGLFGYTLDGTVQNTGIVESYIRGQKWVGGIAGKIDNGSTINNCYSISITSRGSRLVGGISGETYNSSVSNCHNSGIIYGDGQVGGIAGAACSSSVSYCYNTGTISGDSYKVGGVVGDCFYNASISHSYNTGRISGTEHVGGVAGINYAGNDYIPKVENCYNTGEINGTAHIGGVVGMNEGGVVNYCFNSGTISADDAKIGGVVGDNFKNSAISNSYNVGTVSGNSIVGGVAGYNANNSTVSNSYNIGNVSGNSRVGGVVGGNNGYSSTAKGIIRYCYATQSTLYNDYNSNSTITYVSKKTAAQMKNLSNLSGFSTSVWGTNENINDGYPYLKSNYNVNVRAVTDTDIQRSFANIDGIVYAESKVRGASAGGILGQAHGTSAQSKSTANGLLAIANNISAKTSSTSSSYTADSGYIVGWNSNNYFDFTGAYYNSDILSNGITNTTGTSRPTSALKIPSFLTNLVGLNAYKSLDYLKEDETAVWVIKNGELPELYYNCLNDITISEDIENGTITANKTQGIDGEVVEITAAPAEGYVLNKAYVNGEEIVGTTFEIAGDSEIYATFIQETPEYTVSLKSDENASATLINADEENIETFSLMSVDDESVTTLTAADGEEIAVNAIADEEYTVDAVYVNGEEIVGDNFILTEDTEVTLEVSSLSTEIKAITNDPRYIDAYFAVLSGSVEENEENIRYITYWKESESDEVFVTEIEEGGGDYTVTVGELEPETTYCYQMNDSGEVKTFTTLAEEDINPDEPSQPTDAPTETATPQETNTPTETDIPTETDTPQETDIPQQTEQPSETDEPIIVPETMSFEIQNAAVNDKVTANIVNISDAAQSGIVIFAAYTHDGKLVSVKCQNIDNIAASDTLPCEFDIPEGAEKYKLLVWNSWKHIIPLAESVEVK